MSLVLLGDVLFGKKAFCVGSSGTALYGVNDIPAEVPSGSKVVVILPDGIRNYMTKMMDNDWLTKKSFFRKQCCQIMFF